METITLNVAINTWIVFWSTYWIIGSLITYKGHVDNVRPVKHLKEVISVLLLNMVWTFLSTIILWILPLRSLTDIHIILKFLFSYVVLEIYFFHIHLCAHQKNVYKYLHKMHHRFTKCYSLTAMYCTGYEAVVVNSFSVGLGPLLFQMEEPWIYLWFFLVSLNAVASHSGYRISWLIDGAHDLHHSEFNYNFSTSTFLDRLYGTYKNNSIPINFSSDELDDDELD